MASGSRRVVVVRESQPERQTPRAEPGSKYGRMAGKLVGGYFGMPEVGGSVGNAIGEIFGVGGYRVKANSMVRATNFGAQANQAPTFKKTPHGMIVCHREQIADIFGGTDFNSTMYPINPGMSQTFPWLSKVALQFEEYNVLGMVFTYKPLSGMVTASTPSLGSVVYATNYNAAEPAYVSKNNAESSEFCTSTVPFETMIHPIECAKNTTALKNLYIRGGALASGVDPQFYDMGNFQVATVGMPSTYNVGELWVSYHIELIKPRTNPVNYSPMMVLKSTTGILAASPLGTAGSTAELAALYNNFAYANGSTGATTGLAYGGYFTWVTGTTAKMCAVGVYFVRFEWSLSTTAISAIPTLSLGTNLSTKTSYSTSNAAIDSGMIASDSKSAVLCGYIQVLYNGTSTANTLTIGGLTGMDSPAKLVVTILPMNSAYPTL